MNNQNLPKQEIKAADLLKEQIRALQTELEAIHHQTNVFEDLLRTHLSDSIIEEIELSALYKAQKKEKKEKREIQKAKGKNYKSTFGLNILAKKSTSKKEHPQEENLRKSLYREAILLVHPDKFTMREEDADAAHAITVQLIDLYKNGTTAELTAFHAQILNGNVFVENKADGNLTLNNDASLELEKEQLEMAILRAKNRSSYQVLITFKNPMDYVEELKHYYFDRISKLKKRTRTV
jgi:hypothetical protein